MFPAAGFRFPSDEASLRGKLPALMSDTLALYRQSFQIQPGQEDDALRAIKDAHSRDAFPAADLPSAATLAAALGLLGFALRRDGRGYIVGIFCPGDVRAGVEARLFPALGPHVEPGSFVDLMGHPDDGFLRYRFDGGRCIRKNVRMSARAWTQYVATHEAETLVAERLEAPVAPSWQEAAKTMPKVVPVYAPASRFEPTTWLRHPKFGAGLVISARDGKIRVLFETGERTLVARP